MRGVGSELRELGGILQSGTQGRTVKAAGQRTADRREASDWSLPAETRRHASERAANCREMIGEINAQLDERYQKSPRRR